MKTNSERSASLRLALLGIVPALLMGLCVMILHDAPWSMLLMNLGAALLGMLGAFFGTATLANFMQKRPTVAGTALLAAVATTLLDRGLEGVHRWLVLGPIRLHAAAIVDPLLLFAFVVLWQRQRTAYAISLMAAGLILHIVQPDAGQATSLAAGMLALAAIPDKRYLARLVMVIGSFLLMCWAWIRPDPLLPVPMVEEIVSLAFAKHPGLGAAAIVTLGMLPGVAFWCRYQSRKNPLRYAYGQVLAVYFFVSIVVVAFGAFPTPVLGFGASPILGAMLGLGLLARV